MFEFDCAFACCPLDRLRDEFVYPLDEAGVRLDFDDEEEDGTLFSRLLPTFDNDDDVRLLPVLLPGLNGSA